MPDNPDEMPENPDANVATTDHGLKAEDIPRVDEQLVEAIAAADRPKDYNDVLDDQEAARKHRNRSVIRTIGVAAATGMVLVTVAIIKSHSGPESKNPS